MLFRLLQIIAIFFLARYLIRHVFGSKPPKVTGGQPTEEGLDLNRYDVEDAEYRELEDEPSPPVKG